MGGKSNTQTQTSTNSPYPQAQPLLNTAMGDAQKLYQSGGLVKPNTMSTVVPWSQSTMQGMGGIKDAATAGMAPGGYSDQWKGILSNGGYNDAQKTGMEGIGKTATSAFDINSNPAYANVRQRAMDAASGAVNQNAAGLGRYGSGTHQGVLAREVGNVAADMDVNEYRNWQGRSDAAQRDLFNMGQTGQGNLANAYERQQDPSRSLMQLGGMDEDLYGRALNDRLRITNELQNLPLANIQALLAAASGAGNYGTQTQTAQGPSNTFSNLAGGGLTLASLLFGGQ